MHFKNWNRFSSKTPECVCLFVCVSNAIAWSGMNKNGWMWYGWMQNFPVVCNVKSPIGFGSGNGYFYLKNCFFLLNLCFQCYNYKKSKKSMMIYIWLDAEFSGGVQRIGFVWIWWDNWVIIFIRSDLPLAFLLSHPRMLFLCGENGLFIPSVSERRESQGMPGWPSG